MLPSNLPWIRVHSLARKCSPCGYVTVPALSRRASGRLGGRVTAFRAGQGPEREDDYYGEQSRVFSLACPTRKAVCFRVTDFDS